MSVTNFPVEDCVPEGVYTSYETLRCKINDLWREFYELEKSVKEVREGTEREIFRQFGEGRQ